SAPEEVKAAPRFSCRVSVPGVTAATGSEGRDPETRRSDGPRRLASALLVRSEQPHGVSRAGRTTGGERLPLQSKRKRDSDLMPTKEMGIQPGMGKQPEMGMHREMAMSSQDVGHLYMQTIEVRNCVVHYRRATNGTLTEVERVATGGARSRTFQPSTGQETPP